MADDILEQKAGGTFADDLGVEIEYAQVEDVSAEQFNKFVDNASAELNPNLDLTYEDEPQDTVEFGEYIGFLGTTIQEQSVMLETFDKKLEDISSKLDLLRDVISDLVGHVEIEPFGLGSEDDEDFEDVFEDEDLDDYEPKKKGTPGRPAKETPKTPLPPKREKPKKTVVKKKVAPKPTPKPAPKKKAPVKKKAAKKKSKR